MTIKHRKLKNEKYKEHKVEFTSYNVELNPKEKVLAVFWINKYNTITETGRNKTDAFRKLKTQVKRILVGYR